MIFLYIFVTILFLIALFLSMRIHLIFDFRAKRQISLRILCFRFDGVEFIKKLFANEKKSPEKSAEKLERRENNQGEKKRAQGDVLGFIEFLIHITDVIGSTLGDFLSKATVDLREFHALIGTDDAADTALMCSRTTQAANGLCAVLQHFSRFRCNSKNLSITPNFQSSECKFSLHLVLSCTVFHLIGVYLRANIRFFN